MLNNFVKLCLSSAASGLLISISGLVYVCLKWVNDLIKRNSLTTEIFNILGSILFSFGLFTICKFKLHLFTGRIGIVFEKNTLADENKCTYSMKLILMLVINIACSIVCGIIANVSLQKTYYLKEIQMIVLAKTNFTNLNSYIATFMQSIFCGTCVHLAVKSYAHNPVFCIFFISSFVYNGFQHCIANAFYFASYYKKFNVKMLINECIVILGNIIGTLPIALLVNKIQNNVQQNSSSDSLESSSSFQA